jgi:formylglycine-generating enzyme required for sulfatase activity
MILAGAVVLAANAAMADTFGTPGNEFTIDFVTISGATNPTGSYGIVNRDYRMGTREITNAQWDKFKAVYGTPTGSDGGYSLGSYFTGTNVPTDRASWFEAAQFVNWLNTSTNHSAAYKFTGTQGQSDYAFAPWSPTDPGYDAGNPYRNTAAKYVLPTENEWVKAAYWNGASLQTYATVGDVSPTQGNGKSGSGWNYYVNGSGYATDPMGTWAVGSGSQELNGTHDMMGNAWEWTESPWLTGAYEASSARVLRGSGWIDDSYYLASSNRYNGVNPTIELNDIGFRVASVPEPGSLVMLAGIALTTLLYWWRKRA